MTDFGDCGKQIEDACEDLEDCGACTSEKVYTEYGDGFSCKFCNTGAKIGIDTGTCSRECVSDRVSIANADCDGATSIVISFMAVIAVIVAVAV